MLKNKAAIYLIAFSLLALLGMQAMWLYNAIRQEQKFISDNTRDAVKEALQEIEQREDSRIINANIDTLLRVNDSGKPFSHRKKSVSRVFVSDNRRKIIIRETSSISPAYTFKTNSSGTAEVEIVSGEVQVNDKETKANERAKHYELLFKKIIVQSQPENLKIQERINFKELTASVSEKLKTKGILLSPEMAIEKDSAVIFKTKLYSGRAFISLPMFARDIVGQGYKFSISFPSTLGFILKKSMMLILLSVFVTLLLIAVILMLYNKMLSEQKLNQYKNDFINNLTHELKTPLATISLANANISRSAGYRKQENLRQYTKIINEESNKLNNQIEKVFDLSLLGKRQDILELKEYELGELLTDCLQKNNTLLSTSSVQIELSEEPLYACVDKFHLYNAITNILENAVKYSTGKPVITIRSLRLENKCLIKISDKGIGISKEHHKLIFDKFFRVTIKDLHDVKGFGIGLSYVKQVIGLSGGNVYVASELKKGSEFTIELPDAKA